MDKLGWIELRCAKAVFVQKKFNKIIALLTLHVDDGMLFGNQHTSEYQHVKAGINNTFNIKHWKAGNASKPVDYLGEEWWHLADRFEVTMHDYINKLEPHTLARGVDEDRDLSSDELHEYRSLLAKLRWPVARLVPQLAYGVSALAQKDLRGRKVLHLKALNEIIAQLKTIRQARLGNTPDQED